jgi:tRNA-splicing ligase RtcB (3'-phosphate/5'-hydroxy nucleic acid ligase)
MSGYEEILGGRVPIKAWTKGVPVDDGAAQQLRNVSLLPFVHSHIAVMPDVHWGKGATVGSVIATKGAIVPAAVGVDIGCGMMALQTNLSAAALPDNLKPLRAAIEAAVPVGQASHKDAPKPVATRWHGALQPGFERIAAKHAKIVGRADPAAQIATLGGGNHFIELCLDEADRAWIMLHSGSRGIGNRIGQFFVEQAKRAIEKQGIGLPDRDLAYLTEGSELFADYVEAVGWAQDYAAENRSAMMAAVMKALRRHLPQLAAAQLVVNCHHNYVERERHFGTELLVTRKGAVRARAGELGIIPGSMGAKSFIVRGKGNPDSFHSCSHGAGRKLSRGAAKREITLADHLAATAHVECRKDAGVIDESPAAYKDIDAVMAAQADLVEIVHTLRQVVCVKG